MLSKRDLSENFQCDIAFALAITHSLVLFQHFPLDAILNRIASFAKKYVFIEFMPIGLWDAEDCSPEVPSWYTEEWFTKEFRRHFCLLSVEKIREKSHTFHWFCESVAC